MERGVSVGEEVKGQQRMKAGKIKLVVCFPLGMVSLFPVTSSMPRKLELAGVSAFGCSLAQV